MKRKTHEEYVTEVAIKNPNVEVIGTYDGTHTKIIHHCLIHDIYWEIAPVSVLKGAGCDICKKEKFRQSMCKTHEQYVTEVGIINPCIEVIDTYIDAKTQITHYCKKHDIFWKTYPDAILKGCGCPQCGNEKIRDKNGKTHEQYVQEVKIINSNIEVVGIYIGANTPIMHRCLIDGYEWMASPANILHHTGCPLCAGNIKKTQDQYIKEISLINPHVEVLGQYVNMNTPIFHRCKVHNIKWMASPSGILQGCGCLECGKDKQRQQQTKSHEQYIEELKAVNPNITPVEQYVNANIPILHKCLIDGNEWYISPAHTLSGNGCPQCHESKGERQIRLWLDNNGILYEHQKKFDNCRDNKPLPFDFYLLKQNICIEYDGKQHYEPIDFFGGQERFEYTKKHDNIKNEYCKNNGISLLRIPYFKDVEEELNNFLSI